MLFKVKPCVAAGIFHLYENTLNVVGGVNIKPNVLKSFRWASVFNDCWIISGKNRITAVKPRKDENYAKAADN